MACVVPAAAPKVASVQFGVVIGRSLIQGRALRDADPGSRCLADDVGCLY
jgi:hypothetical protein